MKLLKWVGKQQEPSAVRSSDSPVGNMWNISKLEVQETLNTLLGNSTYLLYNLD